VAETQLVRSRI